MAITRYAIVGLDAQITGLEACRALGRVVTQQTAHRRGRCWVTAHGQSGGYLIGIRHVRLTQPTLLQSSPAKTFMILRFFNVR
jgi:hypothetical protein